jgi:flagellar motility protein MotE (MotC chaperone)
MMSFASTLSAPKFRARRQIGRASALAAALTVVAAGLTPLAAEQGWKTTLETEADWAYRSVYERSLAAGQRKSAATKPNARKAARIARPDAEGPPAVIPDVPDRKEDASPAEHADAPSAETVPPKPTDAPAAKAASQPAVDPSGDTLIVAPKSLSDVITTQVLGDDAEQPVETRRGPPGPAEQYCSNIANAASDARFAWQKQTLQQTEDQIKERVQELNGKIAEYQKWLTRRDEFSRKAQSVITNIYAKMKPDAAAQQLTVLDDETAAAVITKLNPRIASAVMAEMDAKRAARLTSIISSAAKGPKGKPPAKPKNGGT